MRARRCKARCLPRRIRTGKIAAVSPPADTGPAAADTTAPAPRVSVVLATYNRLPILLRLLEQLGKQTLPGREFEVVVVDDGSKVPVAPQVEQLKTPYKLTVVAQKNAGAAAARHRGVVEARGEILVLLDDDMQLPDTFLEEHLRWHTGEVPTCVLGRYRSDPDIEKMPLFERWYALRWEAWADEFARGWQPTGMSLCTGNVSMRRQDYLDVGGFDLKLDRSEDAELGLKLEAHGVRLVYSEDAFTWHGSDHTAPEVWMRRAFRYGICDTRISRMHPRPPHADPWRFWFNLPALARPILLSAVVLPQVSKHVAEKSMRAALVLDRVGARKTAMKLCGVVYGMEYFRGMREECGGIAGSVRARRTFMIKLANSGQWYDGHPRKRAVWLKALADLDADHGWYENRYSHLPAYKSNLRRDMVEKIGLQIAAGYRLMRFFREAQLPTMAKLTSRMLRHAYGSDIHYEVEIEPGVMFIHGMGLAIHKSAKIGPRCVIAQNVTLGLGLDPDTRAEGAPTLEAGVRVGAGATLLGPITVGEGSKIMPGVVLTRSVPPYSVVEPPAPIVRPRERKTAGSNAPALRGGTSTDVSPASELGEPDPEPEPARALQAAQPQRAARFGIITERQVGIGSAAGALEPHLRSRSDVVWTDVTYVQEGGWIERLDRKQRAGTLRGYLQTDAALRAGPYDALMFLTHNPAVLHQRALGRTPALLWTDVTPLLLDGQAAHYAHQVDRSQAVRAVKHALVQRTFRRAALCVGWSRWAQRSFIDDYGVPESKTRVVPPGIELERWQLPVVKPVNPLPRVLFVGGHFTRKGGDLLLDVYRQHLRGRCELDLVTRDEVAEEPGVRVHRGMQPGSPELLALYRAADLFALPTLGDCFSIASIEAMAMGLPVIVSAVGGIPEIVEEGTSGHLIAPGDGRALLAALEPLLADRERRAAFGKRGRELVEQRFDSRKTSERLLQLLREISGREISGRG